MTETELISLAERVVKKLKEEGKTLSLAESCTGGWLSKINTDVSGASSVYLGGVCSYSNSVKAQILGVSEDDLAKYGAVSEQVARSMAQGVRKAIGADIGIGITGIAGPLSDNTSKPVGLIYISISDGKTTDCIKLQNNFQENIRLQNRLSAIETAIKLLSGEVK